MKEKLWQVFGPILLVIIVTVFWGHCLCHQILSLSNTWFNFYIVYDRTD